MILEVMDNFEPILQSCKSTTYHQMSKINNYIIYYLPMLKKTFTLIEMLIVIVIIGILAAALVPRLQAVQ